MIVITVILMEKDKQNQENLWESISDLDDFELTNSIAYMTHRTLILCLAWLWIYQLSQSIFIYYNWHHA